MRVRRMLWRLSLELVGIRIPPEFKILTGTWLIVMISVVLTAGRYRRMGKGPAAVRVVASLQSGPTVAAAPFP